MLAASQDVITSCPTSLGHPKWPPCSKQKPQMMMQALPNKYVLSTVVLIWEGLWGTVLKLLQHCLHQSLQVMWEAQTKKAMAPPRCCLKRYKSEDAEGYREHTVIILERFQKQFWHFWDEMELLSEDVRAGLPKCIQRPPQWIATCDPFPALF